MTAAGGFARATGAAPTSAGRAGATRATGWTSARWIAAAGIAIATRLTFCDCANAAGGTAVRALGAARLT